MSQLEKTRRLLTQEEHIRLLKDPRNFDGRPLQPCKCGYVNLPGLQFCSKCYLALNLDDPLTRNNLRVNSEYVVANTKIKFRWVTRGPRSLGGLERTSALRLTRKAHKLGYASIEDRFDKDAVFRESLLLTQRTRDDCVLMTEMIEEQRQVVPVARDERDRRWGYYEQYTAQPEADPNWRRIWGWWHDPAGWSWRTAYYHEGFSPWTRSGTSWAPGSWE